MGHAVIQDTSYVLAHAPEMLEHHGSNACQARAINPDDDYLKQIRKHLRPFDQAVGYAPNQCYIGNLAPEELEKQAKPWFKENISKETQGKFGEIITQTLLYATLAYVDAFELTAFTAAFIDEAKQETAKHSRLKSLDPFAHTAALSADEITTLVNEKHAAPLYSGTTLVGCVKAAHDLDINLSSHVMLENLVTKATAVLAGWRLPDSKLAQIQYVIECSEEAIGDVNQRGGGNLAKAIAESLGCQQANGIDLRGFCAGPAHAIVNAAALVRAGVFQNVLVIAGGSVAKLGMNGRDHAKNDMPLLEDVIGSCAVLISTDDGVSPIVNTDILGRHTIGTGSSPQAVTSALISEPLKRAGLTTLDVDKYSAEMQNPEVTQPAGAGNVPEANYKMIAALSVKEGWLQKDQIMAFVQKHGMPGFAPTQGHIPSGIPYIGHGAQAILDGQIKNFMIVGKGSLFLGRMTNQFDGMSVLVERNDGQGGGSAQGGDTAAMRTMLADAMRKVADELGND